MRSPLRTAFLATTAITAVVAFFVVTTLPPAALRLDGPVPPNQVVGSYHIHTVRSDGTGTVDAVAGAAARAGLQFIILTDHGDATRTPDAPAYHHGVLVIDAVEISSTGGHIVALGLSAPAPYPLAGAPADVIEDIHRLGGKAVIAHPDSPRIDLRFRGQAALFDGIEWINADSEWRDETPAHLIATAIRTVTRSSESVASLFARPSRTLARWDAAAMRRPAFGLAAADAHANISWRDGEEPRQHTALARPSYETMFRALAQAVSLDAPLSGDATGDAARILAAITAGASFSIVRAFADPASLDFTAQRGDQRITEGGRLPDNGARTTFQATIPQAPGARLTLLNNGRTVASGSGRLRLANGVEPGAYRIEAYLPGHDVPWIVSNPIVVSSADDAASPAPPDDLPGGEVVHLSMSPADWAIEREPTSTASSVAENQTLRFGFHLAPGPARGQYAALVNATSTDDGIDRIQFVGRADRPLRLSVQVRLSGSQRWRRSVYVDATPRPITVSLQDFEPADAPTTQRPVAARLQSLLFVVDTLNTLPGAEGTIWIADVALRRRAPTSAP